MKIYYWVIVCLLFLFVLTVLLLLYAKYCPVIDSPELVACRHYRLPGQKSREWNREIYYEDMDTTTISKWKSMSSKERVEVIRQSFLFDSDVDWNSYSYEEQEKMLLGNTFVEWKE